MSSPVLERYAKRVHRKAVINGDEFTIRGMTYPEKRRVAALPDKEYQDALSAAFIMLNDDGSFLFTANEGESDEDFAKRVAPMIENIPPETMYQLAVASLSVHKSPPLESIVKNSGETTT